MLNFSLFFHACYSQLPLKQNLTKVATNNPGTCECNMHYSDNKQDANLKFNCYHSSTQATGLIMLRVATTYKLHLFGDAITEGRRPSLPPNARPSIKCVHPPPVPTLQNQKTMQLL
jgi:hypothetical protein